ncbi:MAG: N-acetylneuraminate synthase family protein [Candidatus Hydrogenedentota bacterium]
MSKVISIGERAIGEGKRVFVTAEVGINHNGDFKVAKKLIKAVKESGADAVKLQTYITEKRVPKDSPIYGILKKCELSFKQQKELFDYADSLGIIIYSTPFDDESVDFLNTINVASFKIASFDVTNIKLVNKIAKTKRPIILSRGMTTRKEINKALEIIKRHTSSYAILHCISAYPVKLIKDLNLKTIHSLELLYNCPAGFSDHTIGIEASIIAVACGAKLIEKHFTLSKAMKGPDHTLSTEPKDMKLMISEIRKVEEMLGDVVDGPIDAEKDILKYRRVTRL